ncbi:MAG: sigma-70 family RNA polymerase sigma factor [Gemmatimonadaceae bacterium]
MTSLPSPFPDLDLSTRLGEQLAVQHVRGGDAFALEMIFTAYRAELLALAQQVTGSRAVAEEVVQDVFLAIWVGRERWQIATTLRAYLRRSIHNVAARASRSRTRGGATGVELEAAEAATPEVFASAATAPDLGAERALLAAAVTEATGAMPPRAREVFTLSRDHELSNREIAARLGLSVKTVEAHATRALAVLRQRLTGWRG